MAFRDSFMYRVISINMVIKIPKVETRLQVLLITLNVDASQAEML